MRRVGLALSLVLFFLYLSASSLRPAMGLANWQGSLDTNSLTPITLCHPIGVSFYAGGASDTCSLVGAGVLYHPTPAVRGTLTNLFVNIEPAAQAGGTASVFVNKNGATLMACTIPVGQTACSYLSAGFGAGVGDIIQVEVLLTAPNAPVGLNWALTFTPAN
jgi:hypothetical protein